MFDDRVSPAETHKHKHNKHTWNHQGNINALSSPKIGYWSLGLPHAFSSHNAECVVTVWMLTGQTPGLNLFVLSLQ